MEEANEVGIVGGVDLGDERLEFDIAVAPCGRPRSEQVGRFVEVDRLEFGPEFVHAAKEVAQPLCDIQPELLLRLVGRDIGQCRIEHGEPFGETSRRS